MDATNQVPKARGMGLNGPNDNVRLVSSRTRRNMGVCPHRVFASGCAGRGENGRVGEKNEWVVRIWVSDDLALRVHNFCSAATEMHGSRLGDRRIRPRHCPIKCY